MTAQGKGMTHREKVERLIADLQKNGVSPYTTAPPVFRLLWALGLPVPPPFFLGFFPLALFSGAWFGILWGAIMWLLQWRAWRLPPEMAVGASLAAGLLFGLSLAAYYRWKAARLRLPRWEDYPEA